METKQAELEFFKTNYRSLSKISENKCDKLSAESDKNSSPTQVIWTTDLETKNKYEPLMNSTLNSIEKEMVLREIVDPKNKITNPPERSHVPQQEDSDQKISSYNEIKNVCRRVTLSSDSLGREVGWLLEKQMKNDTHVTAHVQSGAPLERIVLSATEDKQFSTLSKEDFVVLIGGCNNISNNSFQRGLLSVNKIKKYLELQIEGFKHTNVILSTVPYRYDVKEDDIRNRLIKSVNSCIRKIAQNHSQVYLLELHLLERRYHTKQGLHFNKKGKNAIALKIKDLVESIISNGAPKTCNNSEEALSSTVEQSGKIEISENEFTEADKITILKTDMRNVIRKADSNVVFAHCVSSDFYMGAGVAVPFKDRFGKPKSEDLDSKFLACQEEIGKPTVYSLITKARYFQKPKVNNYDQAIAQFTEHFKSNGHKNLTCSPWGCVRDGVSLEHFGKRIVQFQRDTKASVTIVVFNEHSNGIFGNGLTFPQFVKKLEQIVRAEQSIITEEHDRVFNSGHMEDLSDSTVKFVDTTIIHGKSETSRDSLDKSQFLGFSDQTITDSQDLFSVFVAPVPPLSEDFSGSDHSLFSSQTNKSPSILEVTSCSSLN